MAHFYTVALTGRNLEPLTYASQRPLSPGQMVRAPLRGKEASGFVIAQSEQPDFKCLPIKEASEHYLDDFRLKLARFIAGYYRASLAETLKLFTPFDRPHAPRSGVSLEPVITLSSDQSRALAFIRQPGPRLLFGDTGSGKSEIYMCLIEERLKLGQSALFLVPEISLTPQFEKRLSAHFGQYVAIWHSKVTKKRKAAILEGIADGSIRIVAGARSALFLPLPDLGVIVVDEEHDESYKSQSRPRYHARDVAIFMGTQLNIPVVLGSATPAVSSYARFERFRLRGQYFQEGTRRFHFLPEADERPSEAVIATLKATLDRKKQAIVFLPTRANFKYLLCGHCGEGVRCPFCEVGMSLHLKSRTLKCHYCGYASAIVQQCPSCGDHHLITNRYGTAEIARLLEEALPGAQIALFDRDAITTENRLKKTLKAFNDGEIDILVGTQMLSKGHNYHAVDLAVVLGLDHLLALPDYRASERAVSLLIQIAGRAGRKGNATVLVQSAQRGFFEPYLDDYEPFITQEIAAREGLWPPHKRLLRALYSDKSEARVNEAIDQGVALLNDRKDVEIIGYGPCAISRIAEKYRYHILIRADSARALLEAAALLEHPICELDVDPLNLS
jgi:primosomal protein N' (replication factor Y)